LTLDEKNDIVNSPINKYFNHTVAPLVSRVLNKEITQEELENKMKGYATNLKRNYSKTRTKLSNF
jgi:hypothetical protein